MHPRDLGRVAILEQVIVRSNLREDCIKEKERFLSIMGEALESSVEPIVEEAVKVLWHLMSRTALIWQDIRDLDLPAAAVSALAPQREMEESGDCSDRHLAALNVLSEADNEVIDWNKFMSANLIKYDGLQTVISFVKQNTDEVTKQQGCQILKMISETK